MNATHDPLERELRALLDAKAGEAGAPIPDARLLRRARRRQAGTVLGGIALAAAVIAGAVVSVRTLAPGTVRTPVGTEDLVETTVNGITITHPADWYVVDPVEAGIQPPSEDLPQLVLLLSDDDPVATGILGCPGLAEGSERRFLLTVQEIPLVVDAPPWPVELQPMAVDPSESRCYPEWSLLRAAWTTAGRSFEARVGSGPDVAEADRAALEAAFASMRFAPVEEAPRAVVLTTGTAGGEDWELIASLPGDRPQQGLELMLRWRAGASGIGGFSDGPGKDIQLGSQVFGAGDAREQVVFGAVPARATRLELVEGSRRGPVEIIDVPDALDAAWDAFVFTIGFGRTAVLEAYDGDRLIAHADVSPAIAGPMQTPIGADAALAPEPSVTP